MVIRTWKSNGDVNVMALEAAVENLLSNGEDETCRAGKEEKSRDKGKQRREAIGAALLAGATLETRLAWFCLAGIRPSTTQKLAAGVA